MADPVPEAATIQQPPPYQPPSDFPPQQVLPEYQQVPQAFPQPQQQQVISTNVVVQQPAVVRQPVFKNHPVTIIDCNGQQVTTQLEYRAGNLTWLICFVIFFFTGLPIGVIAFFMDETKDVYHISPTDGEVVGVYKRMDC